VGPGASSRGVRQKPSLVPEGLGDLHLDFGEMGLTKDEKWTPVLQTPLTRRRKVKGVRDGAFHAGLAVFRKL